MNKLEELILEKISLGLSRKDIIKNFNIKEAVYNKTLKNIHKRLGTKHNKEVFLIKKFRLENREGLDFFILDKIKKGYSREDLNKEYGIGFRFHASVLKRFNLKISTNYKHKQVVKSWMDKLNLKRLKDFHRVIIEEYENRLCIREIHKKYNISIIYIKEILKKNNTKSNIKYHRRRIFSKRDNNNCKINYSNLKFPLNRELSYFLGILASDGNIQSNKRVVSISQYNKEYLELLKSKFGGSINGNNLIINSCKLGEWIYNNFGEYNFIARKSNIIKFPKKDISYPDFIRGLWDGDGSIFMCAGQNYINSSYVSGSYDFLSDLFIFLKKEVGLETKSKINKQGRSNCYNFKLGKYDSIKLVKYLYEPVNNGKVDLFLKRKYDKAAGYFN